MPTLSRLGAVGRRVTLIGMAGVVAMLAAAPAASAATASTDHVDFVAASTYTVVPAKGLVQVKVNVNVTNRIPSTTTTVPCSKWEWSDYVGWHLVPDVCKATQGYYINKGYLWVEKGASNLKVTSSAGKVTAKKSKSTADFQSYDLTFPRILKGQTRTVVATYVIKGGAPRTASTTRINNAYMNFSAITQPTDRASVKVVVPAGFDTKTFGGKVTKATSNGTQTFSSGNVADPQKYGLAVMATNERGFAEAVVKSKTGREIHIQGWPGDAAWMAS